ncbi:GSTM2 isoform 7, partial [Pan troglodytes]
LPYLIDGTHKITQSNAILRYIARKHNLCGESEKEQIREDILENQFMQLAKLCYDPDFEKLKPEYLQALPEMLKLYSQFLGKQPWFLGDKGLEKISAYMKSSRFLPRPVFTKMAVWGNK